IPGLTLTTKTLPLPPISLPSVWAATFPPPSLSEAIWEAARAGCSTGVARRGDALRAVVRPLLYRREHRLGVGRRDEHGVGLLRGDRVDDRRLLIRGELVGPLEVQRHAELLGLGLGAAVHRDVELVALHAGDQRHVEFLAGRGARARAGARAGRRPAAVVVAAARGDRERGAREQGAEHAGAAVSL